MKVLIAEPAEMQVMSERAWRRRNRDKAPRLFTEEFRQAKRFIASTPKLGVYWGERRGVPIRYVLMRKTNCNVFYELHEEEEQVIIVAVRGASREFGPPL